MMEKGTKAKWGNCIGSVLFPFTIVLQDDLLDYVCQAKATTDRKKQSQEVAYTFLIVKLVLKLFGIKVRMNFFAIFWNQIHKKLDTYIYICLQFPLGCLISLFLV